MELKEAIQQILPHYEKAVVEMPKEGHYEWLKKRMMQNGLCYFIEHRIAHSAKIEDLLYYALKSSNERALYIKGSAPMDSKTYEENLQQIQNRVDWMREYLSKN